MSREGLSSDFLNAAKSGDLEKLKECVERNVDVNCVSNKRFTALHRACSAGHVQCVKYLIKKGANANACAEGNITPLHLAAEKGDADVVMEIIAHVTDVNKSTMSKCGGDTPLHWLVKDDCSSVRSVEDVRKIVNIFQEHGANLDAENEDHQTALHLCAQNKHSEIAKVLLELGANPDVYDKDSTTPQKLAVLHGPEEPIAKVFEHVKQTNNKNPVQSPESTDLLIFSGVGVDPIQTDGSSPSQEVAKCVKIEHLTVNIGSTSSIVMGNNTTVTSPVLTVPATETVPQ